MLVVKIPAAGRLGDSSSASETRCPALLVSVFGLGFEKLDGGEVTGADSLLGRDAKDERRTARGTSLDEGCGCS